MNAAEVKASYRRLMDEVGETIAVRRYTGTGPDRPFTDVAVQARVTGYEPHELVGLIDQGDRRVIVLAEDLEDSDITLPLIKGDKIVVRGDELDIEAADDSTRRVAGALVAIELRVRGH